MITVMSTQRTRRNIPSILLEKSSELGQTTLGISSQEQNAGSFEKSVGYWQRLGTLQVKRRACVCGQRGQRKSMLVCAMSTWLGKNPYFPRFSFPAWSWVALGQRWIDASSGGQWWKPAIMLWMLLCLLKSCRELPLCRPTLVAKHTWPHTDSLVGDLTHHASPLLDFYFPASPMIV